MKTKEAAVLVALLATICAVMLLSGCMSITEDTTLADGSTTRTRGLSFASKSGLESMASSKQLSSTNYIRNTSLDGVTTDAETEVIPATIGTLAGAAIDKQGDVAIASLGLLAQERQSERDDKLDESLSSIASALTSLAESQARVEAALAQEE